MKRWSYLRIAAALSALHLALALGSLVLGLSIGLRRWDRGSAGFVESFANGVAGVLLQPGAQFLVVGMPGELEWAIIAANSVLWGALGALAVLGIARARQAR